MTPASLARRTRVALAGGLLAASAAIGAASCDDGQTEYLYVAEGSLTTSIDTSTWTAHITSDLLVGAFLREDAKLGLDAVRIEERLADGTEPMEFTVEVTVVPDEWPLSWLSSEATSVHIEATASVPESRRRDCIPSTEVAVLLDVVTDYGGSTTSQPLFSGKTCW